nr:MAG TPA: Ferripyoverdine receptor, Pyocin-S2 [Microviridae sp.]
MHFFLNYRDGVTTRDIIKYYPARTSCKMAYIYTLIRGLHRANNSRTNAPAAGEQIERG